MRVSALAATWICLTLGNISIVLIRNLDWIKVFEWSWFEFVALVSAFLVHKFIWEEFNL